jgi:hypothetical protein
MALTGLEIRNAKPGAKIVKLSDGGGLQLWIDPKGAKRWRLAYRFNGAQMALAIGVYPATGLKEAREAREAAKRLLAEGQDPNQAKKQSKAAQIVASANTFAAIAAELFAKKRREGKAETTLSKLDWILGLALPDLGLRPITEISSPDVLAVLRRVEARWQLETAGRLRAIIGEVSRYAIATGRAEVDPTFALRGALTTPKTKHRAAIVEPIAFGALLRSVEGYDGTPEVRAALKLMIIAAVNVLTSASVNGAAMAMNAEYAVELALIDLAFAQAEIKASRVTSPEIERALDHIEEAIANLKKTFPGF